MSRFCLLFMFLFAAPLVVCAQKDFDYTIYTTRLSLRDSSEKTLELSVLRKFQKEGNRLKVVSLVNTGDAVEYKLAYLGAPLKFGCPEFMYRILSRDDVAGEGVIWIDPMSSAVTIKTPENTTSFY